MSSWTRNCTLLLFITLVSGCASMSADECRLADWHTIGYEDGVRGLEGGHIARHRKACAKAGVTPDLESYESGRERGLRTFCKPANAYKVATNGYNYSGVCPADMEDDFLDAYEQGRLLYQLTSDVKRTEQEIANLERDLTKAEQDLKDAEERLINDETNSSERQELLDVLKERSRDIQHYTDELVQRRIELDRRQQRLYDYEQDNANYSY